MTDNERREKLAKALIDSGVMRENGKVDSIVMAKFIMDIVDAFDVLQINAQIRKEDKEIDEAIEAAGNHKGKIIAVWP